MANLVLHDLLASFIILSLTKASHAEQAKAAKPVTKLFHTCNLRGARSWHSATLPPHQILTILLLNKL